MMYNDNPILPSDVLVALQSAYKKQSNDTQQKTSELLGSFFVHSQKVGLGIMNQRCLPDDLTRALADLKSAMVNVTQNVSELYKVSSKTMNVEMCKDNVFGICKNTSKCISHSRLSHWQRGKQESCALQLYQSTLHSALRHTLCARKKRHCHQAISLIYFYVHQLSLFNLVANLGNVIIQVTIGEQYDCALFRKVGNKSLQ